MRVLTTLRRETEKISKIIVIRSKCSARKKELYALERHSGVNGDETSDRSHGECDATG